MSYTPYIIRAKDPDANALALDGLRSACAQLGIDPRTAPRLREKRLWRVAWKMSQERWHGRRLSWPLIASTLGVSDWQRLAGDAKRVWGET